MGFIVSDEGGKAGVTVKSGGFLYSAYTDKIFTVADIDESFTPAQLLTRLGDLYYIEWGKRPDYIDVRLE